MMILGKRRGAIPDVNAQQKPRKSLPLNLGFPLIKGRRPYGKTTAGSGFDAMVAQCFEINESFAMATGSLFSLDKKIPNLFLFGVDNQPCFFSLLAYLLNIRIC